MGIGQGIKQQLLLLITVFVAILIQPAHASGSALFCRMERPSQRHQHRLIGLSHSFWINLMGSSIAPAGRKVVS